MAPADPGEPQEDLEKGRQCHMPLLPDSGKFRYFGQKEREKITFLRRNLIAVPLSNFHSSNGKVAGIFFSRILQVNACT